ncbi:hypothetical protein OG413_40310 [Streptomyces sp. NBC_01433]|uniref:hypothetical protein n=1 Tax=Streptomyces sp. NBC_01433 TaxID=2903864 RepID=UPI0022565CEB|nr:hypothetical protein [Streptomyces sp. NBC_01433]MCX4681444.1 hypothetical protein [Streptomyces sp. NBC_01433]
MAAASSRRPSFRTAEYWAAIEAMADDLIYHTASRNPHASGNARGTLQRLSNCGFGPTSLFDLCTLLVLAAPRSPAEPCGPGGRAPATASPTEPTPGVPTAAPIAELKRGPVTVTTHATKRHVQHLRELEGAVAEALLVSPEHPRARDAVRRALMTGGRAVQDATAVYGIVCELFERTAS